MDCSAIIKKISPKTLSKVTFLLLLFWIAFGGLLLAMFLDMEINESRFDFGCDGKGKFKEDYLQQTCYDQYWKQNLKLGIPPYLFVMVNVFLIPIVTVSYSQYAKSIVKELERNPQDAQEQPRNRRRNLFFAYLCQLTINIVFEITCILILQSQPFYHRSFPSNFNCSLPGTQSTFNCSSSRAGRKNVWIRVVVFANGIFASFAFLEIVWIILRRRHGKEFMQNWRFYADHLKSNSAQNDLHGAIQTLKKNCLRDTDKLTDLQQPFGQQNHREDHIHDLTIDNIYVHVEIVDTPSHDFQRGRWQQLQEYPPEAKDCKFTNPDDILDETHKNVLVVGQPGIGKTLLSTKLLRLWAAREAFNGDEYFNVVFLVKFRRFKNNNANLSLRDLLARAETVRNLDDAVWDFIKQEPTKVLLIFDGLDEYSRKGDIRAQEDDPTYENCEEEKMPLSVLYNKLAEGKLLRGASILTTTRPTAVECVRHVRFQRTIKIRGFTSDDVKEYVENISRGNPEVMVKMWKHIKSNINLFSFCYIPMNCFLICHCLLQIILSESSQPLPTKMTDIYKMTAKMFLFNHNREGVSPEELARLNSTHMAEPFDKLPEELQKIYNSLGAIACKGIEEGRLLFESSEVRGLEDCRLLHELPDLKRKTYDRSKSQFCFTHLTVQEFFAAKHLVCTKTDEQIEEFVCNHINNGTWQVVMQFVAGLLKSSLSSRIFIKLLPESMKPMKPEEEDHSSSQPTLTSWPATEEDKYVAVQVCNCLYEINDEQLPVLQNKIKKIQFNAVEFDSCSLAPIDVAAVLHFLENAKEVLYINFSYNCLGDIGANEVKKFLVNGERKLKWLNLRSNYFTDKAGKDFAAALKHRHCKLKTLYLSYNEFTDYAAKDFAAALQDSNCKLESLYLSGNKFKDDAAKDFAAALTHSNHCKLESLLLSFNKFTDKAAEHFAAALKHSYCKLKFLYLSHNELTDKAAEDFAAALKHSNCKLQSLGLNHNKFTHIAANNLAAALKDSGCELQSLYLSYNDFTNEVAEAFAAALMHSSCKLKSLYLMNNNFKKEGRKYLTHAGEEKNCKVYL